MALRDLLAVFDIKVNTAELDAANARIEAFAANLRAVGATVGPIQSLEPVKKDLDEAGAAAEKAVEKTKPLPGILTKAAGAFAAFFAAGAAKGFVDSTLAEVDAIGKLSARIGVTTSEFQVLSQFASESGTSTESVVSSIKTLSKNIDDFKRGAGEGAQAFKDLGLSAEDFEGATQTELLFKLGGALGDLEDVTQRTALAQKVFGRAGLELLPGFKNGSAAAQQQLKDLEALAVVYDQELIAQTEAFNDTIGRTFGIASSKFKASVLRLIIPIGERIVEIFRKISPAIDAVGKGFAEVMEKFLVPALKVVTWALNVTIEPLTKFFDGLTGGENIIKRFGWALLLKPITMLSRFIGPLGTLFGRLVGSVGGFGGILRTVGRLLFRFLLPMILLDDLIGTLTGQDSLISRFFDSFLGAGFTAEAVGNLKENLGLVWDAVLGNTEAADELSKRWEKFSTDFKDLIIQPILDDLSAFWDETMAGVNSFVNSVGESWKSFWDGLPGPVRAAVDLVIEGVKVVIGWIDSLLKKFDIVKKVSSFFGGGDSASAPPPGTPVTAPVVPGAEALSGFLPTMQGGNTSTNTINDQRVLTLEVNANGPVSSRDLNQASNRMVEAMKQDSRRTRAALGGT